MKEPFTEELLNDLLDATSADDYLLQHRTGKRNLCGYLQELLRAHGLVRKDVVREAQLNDTYGYQIFTGQRRHPSRDILLQIALAMRLSLRETNRLLQAGEKSQLYCKDRRDAIITFCLNKNMSLVQTNEALYSHGELVLGD